MRGRKKKRVWKCSRQKEKERTREKERKEGMRKELRARKKEKVKIFVSGKYTFFSLSLFLLRFFVPFIHSIEIVMGIHFTF